MAISIHEYVDSEHTSLEKFRDAWVEANKRDPEIYPLEIPEDNAGIWWEMYTSFCDTEKL